MDHSKSIINLFNAGKPIPEISRKWGVPKTPIYYLIIKFKKLGMTDRT
jgi:hypothetical protein